MYAQSSIGLAAFGGNYLFALDGNNGLKAFLLDPNYVPPQPEFAITSLVPVGTSAVLTWPTTLGVNYQVQYRTHCPTAPGPTWGMLLTATGSPLSYTNNPVNASARFYRVRGQ